MYTESKAELLYTRFERRAVKKKPKFSFLSLFCFPKLSPIISSGDSVANVVTRLRARKFGFRIATEENDFCFLQNSQADSGDHPACCSVTGVASRRHKVHHSPSCSAQVKNE
jgi:hypothetical protein